MLEENFRGWDLFDGLNSRVFSTSPLTGSRFCRLAWIQFFKKSPLNFRRIAGVPKEKNPKGVGLFASALFRLGETSYAERLLDQLLGMRASDYSGHSWGYNFDWQARAFFVPKGKPNMVTTVFVAQAFLDAFERTGDEKWLEPARGACTFIMENLLMEPGPCFAYIPGEPARVHNANMLGAALLGRVYEITGEKNLFEVSKAALGYSVKALRSDFSWPYGERDHHRFVDNFHTGFNLVSLNEWMQATGEHCWEEDLRGAYRYFLETFWLQDGCPKYYHDRLYPVDIHCSAQGIVTCVKLKKYDVSSLERAKTIATWAIENMQDPDGYFYYQKTRWYTNKIPYIRWSQAWMLYSLAHLLELEK